MSQTDGSGMVEEESTVGAFGFSDERRGRESLSLVVIKAFRRPMLSIFIAQPFTQLLFLALTATHSVLCSLSLQLNVHWVERHVEIVFGCSSADLAFQPRG